MQDKISLKNRFVNEVLQFLPNRIKQSLIKTDTNILTELEEIRLRSGKPAMLHYHGTDGFCMKTGGFLTSLQTCSFQQRNWQIPYISLRKFLVCVSGGYQQRFYHNQEVTASELWARRYLKTERFLTCVIFHR